MSGQNQNFNYTLFERTVLKLFLFGMRRGQIRVDSSQQQQQQQACALRSTKIKQTNEAVKLNIDFIVSFLQHQPTTEAMFSVLTRKNQRIKRKKMR